MTDTRTAELEGSGSTGEPSGVPVDQECAYKITWVSLDFGSFDEE